MTEAEGDGMDREETPPFASLAAAAARLLGRAIEQADPGDLKDIKQITGALKDLKELMDGSGGEAAGLVIRIEGDPLDE